MHTPTYATSTLITEALLLVTIYNYLKHTVCQTESTSLYGATVLLNFNLTLVFTTLTCFPLIFTYNSRVACVPFYKQSKKHVNTQQ